MRHAYTCLYEVNHGQQRLVDTSAHVPPDQWQRALDDLETYRRELPRLLKDGHAGRYALIRSGQVVSVWDALQSAHERFGAGPVATYKINALDIDRFFLLDASVIGKEQ